MLGRIATSFQVPVVPSTVYVNHGMFGTNPEVHQELSDVQGPVREV